MCYYELIGSTLLPVNISFNTVSPTVISVQWNILKACASLTNHTGFEYKVKYNKLKTIEVVETLNITGKVNDTRAKVFLKGLTPHKNYSIQIVVVDEQGIVRHFTDPVTVHTQEDG